MTTYAYPITLTDYVFDELERLLKLTCEEWEKEGHPSYNSETGEPMSVCANILEIMKETKELMPKKGEHFAPTITFILTDYLFIPLKNLLKERCKLYKEKTGNDSFNPLTGEPQHSEASMFEAMRFAIKNISLNSWSSFTDSEHGAK
jgi:uncharacterized Fe-S radical SAM superfamily protein PflX